jgi:hypothetical protein
MLKLYEAAPRYWEASSATKKVTIHWGFVPSYKITKWSSYGYPLG